MLIKLPTTSLVRCSVYRIYFVRTRIYIYYYTHSEKDNFLCLHNFDFYHRTEGVGVVFDVRSYPVATYIMDKD